MQPAIYEILESVEKAKTEDEKIDILRKNRSRVLVDILQGTFDKRIIWLLPEGPAPYKPNQGVGIEGALYHEARKMPYFVANAGPQYEMSQNKREIMFIQFLESIHPKDAELMVYVKDKKLPYPSITADLVFGKAFHDMNVAYDPSESNIQSVSEEEKAAAGVVTDTTTEAPVKPKRKRKSRAKKPVANTDTKTTSTRKKTTTTSSKPKRKRKSRAKKPVATT